MSIQDYFVCGLIVLALGLCALCLWQDSRIRDLEQYVKRRLK